MPDTGSGKYPYPNTSIIPDVPADILLLAQRIDLMSSGWTLTADATSRAALVTNGDAYEGLHVYQIDTGVTYVYKSLAWVDASTTSWTSYSTTLGAASGTFATGTGGSAEKTAEYKYVAGRVVIRYKFVLGTSGASMGTGPTFTAPFNLLQQVPDFPALTGDGSLYDNNTTDTAWSKCRLSGTSASVIAIGNYTGTYANITSTSPWTWAAGDTLSGEVWADPA